MSLQGLDHLRGQGPWPRPHSQGQGCVCVGGGVEAGPGWLQLGRLLPALGCPGPHGPPRAEMLNSVAPGHPFQVDPSRGRRLLVLTAPLSATPAGSQPPWVWKVGAPGGCAPRNPLGGLHPHPGNREESATSSCSRSGLERKTVNRTQGAGDDSAAPAALAPGGQASRGRSPPLPAARAVPAQPSPPPTAVLQLGVQGGGQPQPGREAARPSPQKELLSLLSDEKTALRAPARRAGPCGEAGTGPRPALPRGRWRGRDGGLGAPVPALGRPGLRVLPGAPGC